jgi:hypothetical protein
VIHQLSKPLYPHRQTTGASKWNPIEHRLFSEISQHEQVKMTDLDIFPFP